MEKRERVLKEALQTNEIEKDKWNKYINENEMAIENLEKFGKCLTVDVMVPIGRKALVPGQLVHTNEVLVGHYQDYFTKCSAHKAKEICQLRIKKSKEHLEKLDKEADLFENKLVKPLTEGVFGDGEKHEIIEEYNEEEERKWKELHKIKVKKAKLEERKLREANSNQDSTDICDKDVNQILEEAELMEELEQELDKLQVDTNCDVLIQQLMNNEVNEPNKKINRRISHSVKMETNQQENAIECEEPAKDTPIDVIDEESNENSENNDTEESVEGDGDDEVRVIKKRAEYLSLAHQVDFYAKQMQIIQKKISRISSSTTEKDIDEKIRLLMVLDRLEDLIELIDDYIDSDELDENGEDSVNNKANKKRDNPVQTKRKVSFALEDDKLEYDTNDAIADMLKNQESGMLSDSDITKLKAKSIKRKVEENRHFVSEVQSEQDFNLIDRIMEHNSSINTVEITFTHSKQEPCENSIVMDEKSWDNMIPGKPSDIYDQYMYRLNKATAIFLNSYAGEEDVKVPILKERDRSAAYENSKAKFSNPLKTIMESESSDNKTQNHKNARTNETKKKKSILRSKSNVLNESQKPDPAFANQVKRIKKINKDMRSLNINPPDIEDEYMTAYYKVMNDVIEKPLTEPDPLPSEKFVDVHKPKKRISHFKEMRRKTASK